VFSGAAQESFKCPDDYGFYPHSKSCDKYYKCEDAKAELKTCGNGLAFDASDPKYLTENCDYLHNVDCGDRTQIGEFLESTKTFSSGMRATFLKKTTEKSSVTAKVNFIRV
jgi:Chitin binding Peritrophin-A domain